MCFFFCKLARDSGIEAIETDGVEPVSETKTLVEIRAVFINCQLNEAQSSPDTEAARFQREELFKHNALRDCDTKLALTLKLASLPEGSSDEYIPIDHVIDGPTKKRVRLLNPYVLRLRWENPLQAYKLQNKDTVTGVFAETDKRSIKKIDTKHTKDRITRSADQMVKDLSDSLEATSFFTASHDTHEQMTSFYPAKPVYNIGNNAASENCLNTSLIREKRQQQNVFVEPPSSNVGGSWISNFDSSNAEEETETSDAVQQANLLDKYKTLDETQESSLWKKTNNQLNKFYPQSAKLSHKHHIYPKKLVTENRLNNGDGIDDSEYLREIENSDVVLDRQQNYRGIPTSTEHISSVIRDIDSLEKTFSIYDIGSPDVWCVVHVQLFEKLNTPEGKTVWNDITKGEVARQLYVYLFLQNFHHISHGFGIVFQRFVPDWFQLCYHLPNLSLQQCIEGNMFILLWSTHYLWEFVCDSVSSVDPEWRDQDLHIRYRSAERTSQEQYTLPAATNLCLIVPHTGNGDDTDYIIVPTEDVVLLNNADLTLKKRNEMDSSKVSGDELAAKRHRKVMVRIERSLQTDIENLDIVKRGSEQFLMLPHRWPHHVQIDLEARADDNQLIRVGADGRITTAVSDNSRHTRTVFTVQATNTGLAAAKFRVKTRDCGPEVSNLIETNIGTRAQTDLVLIPPRHTRRISLDLPVEFPADVAHCSLALVNQDDESVAIRDVTIKRGDRCFCVWHCACVCLSEDPKLLCREMSESRQAAAGLSRSLSRRTRNVCYPDRRYINISVVVGGVLTLLFLLGLLKACLGLIFPSIGTLYLDKIVVFPRMLDRYYEASLADRRVVYDEDGWPVHPNTKERNVRFISRGMEFVLNIIFFIAAPCTLFWNGVKNICGSSKTQNKSTKDKDAKAHLNTSVHDFQEEMPRLRLRRTRRLRRWMTPEAEQLSTNLWRQGLLPQRSVNCKFMQPLLHADDNRADGTHSSSVDSEQEDTEYVITQMQKSKESLTRNQMMNNNNPPSKK
ncbi:uncharacterized protein LOC106136903 [Amyelois transitella]|uniref:uncharacterized protein LOC106136903 n=1 Tax=Amyelois transitella TaxID=680683 RepID=UPI00298FB848|nr:uncharacterized protein LOC106136903 [Amyelois transitella]